MFVGLLLGTFSMGFVLIGDSVLNGVYTVYDRDNTRVGFAPASCGNAYSATVTSTAVVLPIWAWATVGAGALAMIIVAIVLGRMCYLRAQRLESERQPMINRPI
jgi:hypothetical protein